MINIGIDKQRQQILHNQQVHNSAKFNYEHIHVEIFNPTEQLRITSLLDWAISQIATNSSDPLILDFGCGTGNLSKLILELGHRVLAVDISIECLMVLKNSFKENTRLDCMELNGVDLKNIKNNSIDMVATYSVLHHVPDYLKIVREFIRIVKPGGIIYIDHEVAPSVWLEHSNEYSSYLKELQAISSRPLGEKIKRKIGLLVSLNAWKRLINRTLYGLNDEGDIHVTRDDHIEWGLIEEILQSDCFPLKQEDYLLCRESEEFPHLHTKYSAMCSDMRAIVFRKR